MRSDDEDVAAAPPALEHDAPWGDMLDDGEDEVATDGEDEVATDGEAEVAAAEDEEMKKLREHGELCTFILLLFTENANLGSRDHPLLVKEHLLMEKLKKIMNAKTKEGAVAAANEIDVASLPGARSFVVGLISRVLMGKLAALDVLAGDRDVIWLLYLIEEKQFTNRGYGKDPTERFYKSPYYYDGSRNSRAREVQFLAGAFARGISTNLETLKACGEVPARGAEIFVLVTCMSQPHMCGQNKFGRCGEVGADGMPKRHSQYTCRQKHTAPGVDGFPVSAEKQYTIENHTVWVASMVAALGGVLSDADMTRFTVAIASKYVEGLHAMHKFLSDRVRLPADYRVMVEELLEFDIFKSGKITRYSTRGREITDEQLLVGKVVAKRAFVRAPPPPASAFVTGPSGEKAPWFNPGRVQWGSRAPQRKAQPPTGHVAAPGVMPPAAFMPGFGAPAPVPVPAAPVSMPMFLGEVMMGTTPCGIVSMGTGAAPEVVPGLVIASMGGMRVAMIPIGPGGQMVMCSMPDSVQPPAAAMAPPRDAESDDAGSESGEVPARFRKPAAARGGRKPAAKGGYRKRR
jgi:hypothetical protein